MAEYIVKGAKQNKTVSYTQYPNGHEFLQLLPVREEIVRCEDCEYFETGYTDGVMFDETVCWAWDNGHDYPSFTNPDGFCHRGKRKEGR